MPCRMIRTNYKLIWKPWPALLPGPTEASFTSMVSPGASFLPRPPSGKFVSIRIRFLRSTTRSGTGALKSSPSLVPINGMAKYQSMRAIPR